MNDMKVMELLVGVARQPLQYMPEDVIKLAQQLWFQESEPSDTVLEVLAVRLNDHEFRRVLCVLEMLSQYPVCKTKTAKRLQRLTEKYHLKLFGNEPNQLSGRYSPSKRWHLKDETSALRQALLPLQTRTFAFNQKSSHGFNEVSM
ncbi:hypothetical protein [Nitrincola sp. MINF-07-Sa-05]|uniref:hypothetical protein n=1 Tax=Nitrincola salilacus TaxID=3400273 RepID=UPI003917DA2C